MVEKITIIASSLSRTLPRDSFFHAGGIQCLSREALLPCSVLLPVGISLMRRELRRQLFGRSCVEQGRASIKLARYIFVSLQQPDENNLTMCSHL